MRRLTAVLSFVFLGNIFDKPEYYIIFLPLYFLVMLVLGKQYFCFIVYENKQNLYFMRVFIDTT